MNKSSTKGHNSSSSSSSSSIVARQNLEPNDLRVNDLVPVLDFSMRCVVITPLPHLGGGAITLVHIHFLVVLRDFHAVARGRVHHRVSLYTNKLEL